MEKCIECGSEFEPIPVEGRGWTRHCDNCLKEKDSLKDQMQFDQSELKNREVDSVFDMIHNELEFALQKFPQFPSDPIHAMAVVNEEAGEATKDALQWTYEPHKQKNKDTLRIELVQTAAMCIRMLCGLESGNIKPSIKPKLKYKCGCACDPRYGHNTSCMHDNWDNETVIDIEAPLPA